MSLLKRILVGIVIFVVLMVALFVTFIGPWPTYASSEYASSAYYTKAMDNIDTAAAESEITNQPEPLRAGWAERDLPVKAGQPMGGYSARFNITPGNLLLGKYDGDKLATGVHDPVCARALALNDGKDTAVIIGLDMLIVPPNIADAVRTEVARSIPLTPNQLLFGASHTHCGPGGFAPGLAARFTGGEFNPELTDGIVRACTDAIIAAYNGLQPAKLAHRGVDAPQFIRNRARDNAPVDSELSYLVVERADGKRCILTSFSAHPTTYGDEMLEFSAEYPGALMSAIERTTGADALYIGGALGSMGPRVPDDPANKDRDATARIAAMGEGLAALLLADLQTLTPDQFKDRADVASIGIPVGMPSPQMRPFENSTKWRLSPFVMTLMGNPNQGWLQGVRVGDLFFIGLPFDFSGEVSIEWKQWAQRQGLDLWTSSFCAAYCGYLSPDKYYLEMPLDYETGFMSWFGPDVEAYFGELFEHVTVALVPQTSR